MSTEVKAEKIKPALTAEDWKSQLEWINGGHRGMPPLVVESIIDAHVDAALALYGQPFGFTREDVGILREAAKRIERERNPYIMFPENLSSLADRIEALLPPEA
jgi:hypothetical protein